MAQKLKAPIVLLSLLWWGKHSKMIGHKPWKFYYHYYSNTGEKIENCSQELKPQSKKQHISFEFSFATVTGGGRLFLLS